MKNKHGKLIKGGHTKKVASCFKSWERVVLFMGRTNADRASWVETAKVSLWNRALGIEPLQWVRHGS